MEPLLLISISFYPFMATIHRENIGLLNDRITVQVEQGDYMPQFEKALKDYSRKASMPGFRKGMVPTGLIKKMHGQSILTEEVVRTVENELSNYLQAEKLDLFGQPISDNREEVKVDVNAPSDYAFDFEIGLKPEFSITPLENDFNFTRYKIKVVDQEVTEEVERLQKKAGESREIEAVTTEDDILNLQFIPSDEKGETAEDAEGKSEKFIVSYFAPAVRETLKGKKAGDTLVVKLSEALEEKELDWLIRNWKLEEEAKDAYYLLKIEKVEEIIPKELTEDLFNEVYPGSGIKTEAEFRERIRQDDERYWAQEAGKRLDNEIFEKLVHETSLELPVSYFKKWIKRDGEQLKTDEEVEAQYGRFEHEMRWSLISGKIISDNGIEVSPEALREDFKDRLKAYFGPNANDIADDGRLDQFADSMMKDEKAVNETYNKLLTGKLFNWLREKATIEEKEVTADEFLALPHNHHHHEHA